ncbi:hypothetical protein HRbin36_00592 [bacterium HR36]|nr:hypothetical protein HRbin36_00592 [bacterium HR36]
MAEYVAQKAQANAPDFVGKGTATDADKTKADRQARRAAYENLSKQIKAYAVKWYAIDDTVQQAYDKETDHSRNAQRQADWQANWQKKVDAILQQHGWK